MNYAEKLRDPRWIEFRQAFLQDRLHSKEIPRDWCEECGETTVGPIHVHHTVYYDGHEPWEYEFSEMRGYCKECHDRIHAMENSLREFVRTVEPHECYEFRQLLDCLITAQHHGLLKVGLARCKNTVRHMLHQREEDRSGTADMILNVFEEMNKRRGK